MIYVLHVVVAGDIGGAERVVADLAAPHPQDVATQTVHSVAVLSPNPKLPIFFSDLGVRVHNRGHYPETPSAFVGRSFGTRDRDWLVKVIERERADLVHLHTFGAHVLGIRAARAASVGVVRTEHSVRVYTNDWCWLWSRWSLQRSDRVIAVSHHVADVAKQRAPWLASRLEVISNGVQVPAMAAGTRPQNTGPFRFVLVARLEPRKGVDLALRALARVPNVALDIVGDGDLRVRLTALAAELGVRDRVTFHGYLREPAAVVRSADAALSSSLTEGLPLALLEAMAQGKPAVAVPVGGIVEFVIEGQTGWLAAAREVDALAYAMTRAAQDRMQACALGDAARALVQKHYSVLQMRANYDRMYLAVSGSGDQGKPLDLSSASEMLAGDHAESLR